MRHIFLIICVIISCTFSLPKNSITFGVLGKTMLALPGVFYERLFEIKENKFVSISPGVGIFAMYYFMVPVTFFVGYNQSLNKNWMWFSEIGAFYDLAGNMDGDEWAPLITTGFKWRFKQRSRLRINFNCVAGLHRDEERNYFIIPGIGIGRVF